MEIKIDVPDYEPETGFTFNWQDGFTIKTEMVDGELVIKANKEGLISLANHLLNLSQDKIPNGYHFHLDSSNSLEDDSVGIVLERSN